MSGKDERQGIRLPTSLKAWAKEYASRHNTTVSALVVRFLTRLRQEDSKRNDAEQI